MAPSSAETAIRYANVLIATRRLDDALLIARTTAKLTPEDKQLENLVKKVD